MALEKFVKQQRTNHPAITIRKNGEIYIHRQALEQYNLKKVGYVTLHFDQKESVIGIRPTDDDKDPSAFRICKQRGRVFTVFCKSFLKYYQIPFKEVSKIYPASWDEKTRTILTKITR